MGGGGRGRMKGRERKEREGERGGEDTGLEGSKRLKGLQRVETIASF